MGLNFKNIDINDRKKAIIVFFSLVFLFVITGLGVTYAFYTVGVSGTNIAGEANCYNINYTKGQDIDGELVMGEDYTSGQFVEVVMSADPNCATMLGTLYLDTDPNSTMDYTDQALQYTVLEGSTVVSSGEVTGKRNQPIYKDFKVKTTATTYKIYIWLDINKEDMTILTFEDYMGIIRADVKLSSSIGGFTEQVLAIDTLRTLGLDDEVEAITETCIGDY